MTDDDRSCPTFYGQVLVGPGTNLAQLFRSCSWLSLRVSGYRGGIELRSTDPAIDIETHDSDGPSYLFGGALLGDVIAGRRMLSDLSESLAGADVRHRIELYEASSEHPSHLWVHAWPEGKA